MNKSLAKSGIVAALYVLMCVLFAPISYAAIQMRTAEILKILPFYNKKYTPALIIGNIVANIFSPLGPIDMLFGLLLTVLCSYHFSRVKTKTSIPFVGAAIVGILIGFELHLVFGVGYLSSMATVAIGEFLVLLAGVGMFGMLEKFNKSFIRMIREF